MGFLSRRLSVLRQPLVPLLLAVISSMAAVAPRALAQAQSPSHLEQLVIYELNRARSNPAAWDAEQDLASDLSGVAPQPPLAVNESLVGSASFHAEEMATHNYFAHQSAVTGDWPNKMARDSGYNLPGFYPNTANNIESIAAGTNIDTALEVLALLIEDAGVVPPGHRIHLLAMEPFFQTHREIGVGHAFNASATFRNYFAIHTAVSPGSSMFLTGVVYHDANGNGRYDLGEGLGGVTISNGVTTTTSNPAGGWAMPVSAGTYTVSAAGGAFAGASLATVSVTASNVAIDFVSGNPRAQVSFAQQAGSPLVAAVLPSSRSVMVGNTATAFATIINAGASMVTGCGIAPLSVIPAAFGYQTTHPATNLPTGTPNTPADIPAGQAQTYIFSITPAAPIAPAEVQLAFRCANAAAASLSVGLNTLAFSASATPIPDIVALAATAPDPGIVNIPGTSGTGAFAVATVNVGATGSITAIPTTGGVTLPVNLFVCATNPSTGACLAPPAVTVTTTIDASATPTFAVFAQGNGSVPFNPATNRVFLEFKDGSGVTRGKTSVAARTQ